MFTLSAAHRQQGFTFVEMAVALVVVGLLTWAVSSAYGNGNMVRDRQRATQLGETLRESLRAFALVNARLPCPDTDGDGWEGGSGGVCAAGDQAGWFPYRSLGFDIPDARFRAAYAVYRRANPGTPTSDADLAVRLERTLDAAGSPHFQDARDLIAALNNANGFPLSADKARLTGNNAGEGAIDCALNVRSHPAFLLVFPLEDRSGDGERFDGPHAANVPCAWAPGTAIVFDGDDVVVAEPFPVLAGWLGARAP